MEPEKKKYGVFISYSHEDTGLISPVVKLISAMRDDLVFQDTKDLRPGGKWEDQLLGALDQAEIVIVFWCRHSANSDYVKNEYEKAIAGNKEVLPVLLDDCQVSKGLSAYQWIDLKNVVSHKKEDHEMAPLHKFKKRFVITTLSIILSLALIFALFITNIHNNAGYSPDENTSLAVNDSGAIPNDGHLKPIPSPKPASDTIVTTVIIILVFVLMVFVLTRYLRKKKPRTNLAATSILEKLNEKLPRR